MPKLEPERPFCIPGDSSPEAAASPPPSFTRPLPE